MPSRHKKLGAGLNRAGSGVTIQGVDRVKNTLSKFNSDLVTRELDLAAKDTANAIMYEAKRLCPVRTGDLRNSIHVVKGHVTASVTEVLKTAVRGKLTPIQKKAQQIKDTSYAVLCGKGFFKGDEFYGGMIEFGTKFMMAQPFMRPAAAAKKDLMRQLFRARIRKITQNSARRRANAAINELTMGVE